MADSPTPPPSASPPPGACHTPHKSGTRHTAARKHATTAHTGPVRFASIGGEQGPPTGTNNEIHQAPDDYEQLVSAFQERYGPGVRTGRVHTWDLRSAEEPARQVFLWLTKLHSGRTRVVVFDPLTAGSGGAASQRLVYTPGDSTQELFEVLDSVARLKPKA